MMEGDVIVNVTLDSVPDAGTLLVPVQPVQTYRVPVGPDAGDVTEAVTLAPESNQINPPSIQLSDQFSPPFGIGSPKGELTVSLY